METFLADLLLNNRIPKLIRYTILAVIVGAIAFICLYVGLGNDSLIRGIICFIIGVVMIALGIAAALKIHRS